MNATLTIGALCVWLNPRRGPVWPVTPLRAIRAFFALGVDSFATLLPLPTDGTDHTAHPYPLAKRLTRAHARLQSP